MTTKYKTKIEEAYFSLPYSEMILTRNSITEKCGVTRFVFYNWMSGKTPIPKTCKSIIALELKKKESELFN